MPTVTLTARRWPSPRSPSQADAATVGVIVGAGVVYIVGAAAIRQLLNRRRMAAWDADWLATAPAWNRQSW